MCICQFSGGCGMGRYVGIVFLTLVLILSVYGTHGESAGNTPHVLFVSGNAGSAVDFSGAPTSGRAPLMVMFTDLTKGSPSGWMWDFGDGFSSTSENPVHTYSDGGVYTVRLTVQYPDGSSGSLVKDGYIQANPLPLVANFSAVPQSGPAPLTVQFSDRSTGAMVWLWDFGDGSQSMLPDPSHTYTEPGTYSVTLKVSNEIGETATHKMDIQVTVSESLSADFVGTPQSGQAPLQVQFVDRSRGEITSRTWDFGDGTRDSSVNPMHTYTRAGTYAVTLTVRDVHDTLDIEEKPGYIAVSGNSPLVGTIPISAGWNFVSVPGNLAPGRDTAQIFEHLDVAGHSALVYEAQKGWVPLLRTTPIKPFMAIWVYSARADSVPLTFDASNQVIEPRALSSGWNAAGFSDINPIEARKALLSVHDTWQECLGFTAGLQRYDTMIMKGVDDERLVQPYSGYWVYMSKPGILSDDES